MEQAIAHYNLLDRLGEGGLGEVFRARDTKVGRTVALKVLSRPVQGDDREAFLADARAAATLSHPNIATLFEVGDHDGFLYLAYEFVSGITLGQEMDGRAMRPRRAVELAVQVADALADAHARGILHGDLRPDTVMVTAKGSARVLDFGLARWTRGGTTRARAARDPDGLDASSSTVVGYMSPEQALGGLMDGRTDVFSLAVLLYEMLTGRNPFAGATPAATILNIISSSPPPASSLNPDVTSELDAVVARALTKDIESRQQSAAALSAELRSVGAILDVRSGDSEPGELLPLDDDGGGMGKYIALVAILAAAAFGLTWWFLLG